MSLCLILESFIISRSWRYFLFFPRSCIVFPLKFTSTIHLGRIFCMTGDKYQDSLLFNMSLQLIQYLLLKMSSFVTVLQCYLCHNSNKHISAGLFLALYWTGFLYLHQNHMLPVTIALGKILFFWQCKSSNFILQEKLGYC